MESFERYCFAYLVTVPHPLGGTTVTSFSRADLQRAVACARLVFESPVQEPRLADLRDRFVGALRSYLQTPRDQQGALVNAVERLAQLVEPFLKKLTFVFYPGRTRKSGGHTRPLWHLSAEQILMDLGLVSSNLKNHQDTYWAAQPAEQAIWRVAIVSRHKGTHEAHAIDLLTVERAATSIITALLLAARHAVQDPQSGAKEHGALQEALQFKELLRVRTETFSVTRELPTPAELLRLYRSRDHVSADDAQAQLLFRAYCAGRGPVFAFLHGRPREQLVQLAYDLSGDPDEATARGATAFLLATGNYVALRRIYELFAEYRLRLRLAEYIQRNADRRDLGVLWEIILRHKSTRVRNAATRTFSKLVHRTDRAWLMRMARSTSARVYPLWLMTAAQLARRSELKTYRRNLTSNLRHVRQLAAIGLGLVGEAGDIAAVRGVAKSKRDNGTKACALLGLAMLAARHNERALLNRLLQRESAGVAQLAVMGVGLLGRHEHSPRVVAAFRRAPLEAAEALEALAAPAVRNHLRRLIQRSKCNNIGRVLVLALCRCPGQGDFVFLMRRFARYEEEMRWDPYEIMLEVTGLVSRSRGGSALLREWLRCEEFWKYYGDQRPRGRLPVRRYENLVLMKGLTGLSFGEIATPRDKAKLRRMLRHSYWAVNRGGANGLLRLADKDDLRDLVDHAVSSAGRHRGERQAIIGLDLAFHCQIPEVAQDFRRFGALVVEE